MINEQANLGFANLAMAEALREKMIIAKINATELAKNTGIPRRRIMDLAEVRAVMTAEELFTFCQFFECSAGSFYFGIYRFSAVRHELGDTVSEQHREAYLLNYFRMLGMTDCKDYICGFVRALATNWKGLR